ncbi:MAG: protein-L-isoaspartate O-methyltransferase [Alphaproteobacteria bacterium]
MTDYAAARLNMVEGQIRPNKVIDRRIIDAMEHLPREKFVPQRLSGLAYIDEDLPLDNGRWLMEPMVLARLVQAAEIKGTDAALTIGASAGYAVALIAHLAETSVGVESDAELVGQAGSLMGKLSLDTAVVVEGTLQEGYPGHGPFDVIFINGGVAEVPDALFEQLSEGGRLVTVERREGKPGEAVLYKKVQGYMGRTVLFDANTPWLTGFEPKPSFQF